MNPLDVAASFSNEIRQRSAAIERGRTHKDLAQAIAATHNAWSAAHAVDLLYHAAGGSSIYAQSDLQRCWGDIQVATQHIMVAQPTYEVVDKIALGIDPKTMF